MCGALLLKFTAFRDRCLSAKKIVEVAMARLHYRPISTNLIRSVDRVAHKLVLDFTLGLDAKVITMYHEESEHIDLSIIQYEEPKDIIDLNDEPVKDITDINLDNHENRDKDIIDINIHNDEEPAKDMIDINIDDDGLTDVLNDFEEIRNSLNEVENIGFNNEFNDINHDSFATSSFSDQVDRLLRGKEMNTDLDELLKKADFSVKAIDSVVNDINTGFLENNFGIKKILEEQTTKEDVQDESNDLDDAEDFLNANINSLPEVLNFNDVSINTTDLNDNDNSNLVATFNDFILDDLDERFLMDPDELTKKKVTDIHLEENKLKIPPKRDKLKLMKKAENKQLKRPIKPRKMIEKERKKEEVKEEKEVRPKKNLKELIAAIDEEYKARRLLQSKQDKEKKDDTEDWLKFGSKFNFRVFVLTEEEQLEELQQKKESLQYKGAPYKCELCVKGFRSQETLHNHMQVHKITHGLFECSICHSRHKSDSRRKRHTNTHRLKFCCTQCEFVARSSQKAEAHYEWHIGKTYTCHYCGEIFGKASTHLSHVRLRHPGRCAACRLCGEAFLGSYGLQLHVRRIHADYRTEEKIELYCFSCRMQFKNREALDRHKATSEQSCSPDSRPCAECGDSFDSVPSLAEHRRRRHSEAPLKCQMCDASFTNVFSRDTHFERVHLDRPKKREFVPPVKKARGARRVMCETCGNKYHSPAALAYHQRSHSGERPFPCPSCPKSFAFAHTLQAHIRTHTGERPYSCAQCPRTFQNANNLRRHVRIVHKGERQYVRCGVCFKWLSSVAAARAHALLHQ